jgi:hypothetical protein
MKKLIFGLVFVLFLLSCSNEKENLITSAQSITDDVNYVQETYLMREGLEGLKDRLIQISVELSIIKANSINSLFETYFENFKDNDLLTNMSNLQEITNSIMDFVLDQWNNAISSPVENMPGKVIGIYETEFARKKVFDNIENAMSNIRVGIGKLNKTKYSNTIELYSILSQYQSLITDVSGSYRSFQQFKQEYNSNFSKSLGLAKIE